MWSYVQVIIMTHRKAYDNHFEDLVKCLPLDDARFIIKLPRSLLPGDTEGKIEAKPTKAEKSLYFLSTVIKPALDVGDTSTFDALISVMENCGFNNVMKVVEDIKSEIVNFDAGMHLHIQYAYMSVYVYIYTYVSLKIRCRYRAYDKMLEPKF